MDRRNSIVNIFLSVIVLFLTATFVSGQSDETPNTSKSEKDRPVKILNRPRVRFPDECARGSGTVRLKATFDKSAKITNVVVFSSASSCLAFEAAVVEAARQIKFKPAVKNGEAVTVVLTLDYSFQ